MNLETGKKEAKLLDAEDDAAAEAPMRAQSESIIESHTLLPKKAEERPLSSDDEHRVTDSLYRSMSALPEPPSLDGMNIHEAHAHLSKDEFAVFIEKLWKARQKELSEANAALRDEVQFMRSQILTLVTPPLDTQMKTEVETNENYQVNVVQILKALENLEWEVQDLDKAKDFHTLGGLKATVQYLNASDVQVRAYAAWVVGSAVKHYPDAQLWALQAGAIPKLLQSLHFDAATKTMTATTMKRHEDASASVAVWSDMQRKVLYALSALLQYNTKCQMVFVRNHGVDILVRLIEHGSTPGLRHKVRRIIVDSIDIYICMSHGLTCFDFIHKHVECRL
jgi:nucleotide exchange factor SIL1